MKTYLKIVNPAVAFLCLLLCLWAATVSDGEFNVFGLVIGGLTTYFFAKGLFCFSAIFMLGQILLRLAEQDEERTGVGTTRNQVLYTGALLGLAVSLLLGLFILSQRDSDEKKPSPEVVTDPPQLSVLEHHRVTATNFVRIAGKLKNVSEAAWDQVRIDARVSVNGVFSAEESYSFGTLKPSESEYFVVELKGLVNEELGDGVTYELSVRGMPTATPAAGE